MIPNRRTQCSLSHKGGVGVRCSHHPQHGRCSDGGQQTDDCIASERNSKRSEIDRTTMDAWADRAFAEAVKKTGRRRLVMSGIVTEVCLAYAVVSVLKDGYEVTIVADAAGGLTRESHDLAVSRMIQAGAVPNTTQAMITEWFRDWAGPLAPAAREVITPFLKETAILQDTYLPPEFAKAADAQPSSQTIQT
jgi:hypothetical protein